MASANATILGGHPARRRKTPLIQVEAQLTLGQLLRAVEQMPQPDLDQFVDRVVAFRAGQRAPRLSSSESELLAKINQGVPADLQSRYDALNAKRRAGTLSEAEHEELLRLVEQVEGLDTRRVEYLAELARLRKISLRALLKDLGIKPRQYA
jgi:hypothetical protein